MLIIRRPHSPAMVNEADINATPKDAMKLRLTGFECSPSFVIRLGFKKPPS